MKRNACQKCVFAVYDDNPHCGLRGFRSDFNVEFCSAENNTLPNGFELQSDGYFSWVEKKKEYPKTYEECAKLLNTYCGSIGGYNWKLLSCFQELLICRDAYWKIAGDEMGLGKPWEPNSDTEVYNIYRFIDKLNTSCSFCVGNSNILEFPTEEMRDAFYENFKEEIESCKELL